ncbi:hypothetical protein TSUD_159520 [Trifolium subterraneum]|uniref:Uncharacterized protein n=1 Tax=Trifolium subterraneum TaxID=3900 RepID=A0A2Z6MY59_TRISU|nr:hypothetical protein TSUD_159520 [Trifolium subterraneum]
MNISVSSPSKDSSDDSLVTTVSVSLKYYGSPRSYTQTCKIKQLLLASDINEKVCQYPTSVHAQGHFR